MKEKILQLRQEGKTYKQIMALLGCSSSTVSYYCGKEQKEKTYKRSRKRRSSDVLIAKTDRFKNRTVSEKSRFFQRRKGSKLVAREDYNFSSKDVLKKIGTSPKCYLSGREIDLSKPKTYSFDHITPASKGGKNTLENLGLTDFTINKMKHDLTIEEFLSTCKEILEFQGYEIRKKGE